VARRPSSAASRSQSSRAGRSGAAPRARSDGKIDIYCPQCGAHFRLPGDQLESKVTCTECTRTFFAKTAAGKRAPKPDNTKVYVGLGLTVVVAIIGLVMLNQSGGKPAPKPVVVNTGPTQADLDREYRRGLVVKWAGRVAQGDLFGVRQSSDMGALQAALGVSAQLIGDERDQAIMAALRTHDATRLLHEMDGQNASADVAAESAQTPTGKATLYLTTIPGDDSFDRKAGAQIEVDFRMDDTVLRVTGFKLTMPPVRRKPRPEDAGKYFKPSTEIAKPEDKELQLGGQKVKVRESPPVALKHEAGTTPEQQQKIDALVTDVLRSADPEADGRLFNRTCNALEKIGKPTIPRLLNALHDLYPDVNGNNQKISQLNKCLLQLTGMEFAYDVRGTGDAAKDKAARESVIRQWFAWWWRFANDTHTDAIDKDEVLEPKEPAKKPAAGKTGGK
jgi:hypothetical protein